MSQRIRSAQKKSLNKPPKRWPHLKVGKSAIAGKGLFTTKALRKGQYIGIMRGPKVNCDGPHVLWLDQPDGNYYLIEVRGPLKYMNHSFRPNVELDHHPTAPSVRTRRAIKAGEELTWFYVGNDRFDFPKGS